jgi:hypothetical protein
MCLNKKYIKIRIGRDLLDAFPIQKGLKQGDALVPLIFNYVSEYAKREVKEN